MKIREEDGIISISQKLMYEIVKKEDEALINALKDYARENCTELKLLDEDKVKEIIKKGIMLYHAEEHQIYSHSYISKDKIKAKIEELIRKIYEYKKWKELGSETDVEYYDYIGMEIARDILQSLLEEKE